MARLTAEELNASKDHNWDFDESEVEIPQLGGSVLLREMTVKRQAKLLRGLIDGENKVTDVEEMQIRLFAAGCIEPKISENEVRKFLPSWPVTEADRVLKVMNKLGAPEAKEEEEAAAEAEFPEAGE